MITEERIAQVCALGPVKAAELLDLGRGGDLVALEEWTVRSGYRKLIRDGATPAAALVHIKTLLTGVRIKPKLTL